MSKHEKKTFTAYVYKITNNVDKLVYVGSTTEDLNIRWSKHKEAMTRAEKRDRPLYKHMRKLGIDCFNIILLEKCRCKDKTDLLKRENKWQAKLNTIDGGLNEAHAVQR